RKGSGWVTRRLYHRSSYSHFLAMWEKRQHHSFARSGRSLLGELRVEGWVARPRGIRSCNPPVRQRGDGEADARRCGSAAVVGLVPPGGRKLPRLLTRLLFRILL